jgi:2-oxoisovalerate dehydrogenase E2 component (dihydrolipoyl transacylase)
VISITGEPGDKVAVGSPLIIFETASGGGEAAPATVATIAPVPTAVPAGPTPVPAIAPAVAVARTPAPTMTSAPQVSAAAPVTQTGRVMTSPANRRRAREAGIDLHTISGSGPGGRIVTSDLVAAAPQAAKSAPSTGGSAKVPPAPAGETTEIKVIGVRRVIAERMSEAKRNIPHFAYVEEVDVTELESLRAHLNGKQARGEPGLTYLPLVIMALTRALESFPQCNVLYDSARGVLVRHRAVHVGIATQTPDGLKVPVVRNAQALNLGELAAAIRQVSDRARTNKATREELTGSTITVTSLGKLGGIASTPVINSPEVAIIGLNKAVDRPVVHNGGVAVRRIMNLSSSFDHRFVDGYDAAAMIQALKDLLEHPATIFIPKV